MGEEVVLSNKTYHTLNWTTELLDCSLPVRFDQFSYCSYDCQYCFSIYYKVYNLSGFKKELRRASYQSFKSLFMALAESKPTGRMFEPYLRRKGTLQWGSLSDPFDEFERKFGYGLKFLETLDYYDWPTTFSTKSVWWVDDERYISLFKDHTHNWHVKISLTTLDEEKARLIEVGAPSPKERLEAIRKLADMGVFVTLRFRPYVIGASDRFEKLIREAAAAGARNVTVEFMCLSQNANEIVKRRYKRISDAVGYDVYEFYRKYSIDNKYMRLNPSIKRPILKAIRDCAHTFGMEFYSSDIHGRDLQDGYNCCGLPSHMVDQRGHFGYAVWKAARQGTIKFSEIAKETHGLFDFEYTDLVGYDTGANSFRARFTGKTVLDLMRYYWNNISSSKSIIQYGVLRYTGVDEEGNVVYKYIGS